METKKEKETEQTEPYKTTCQAADWVLPDYNSILVRWMYGAIVGYQVSCAQLHSHRSP